MAEKLTASEVSDRVRQLIGGLVVKGFPGDRAVAIAEQAKTRIEAGTAVDDLVRELTGASPSSVDAAIAINRKQAEAPNALRPARR